MRLWARLFNKIPVEPVETRMPDGAYWGWVDAETGALSDKQCSGAVQIPFVAGSEPAYQSSCLAAMTNTDKEDDDRSFWKKWFGKKN